MATSSSPEVWERWQLRWEKLLEKRGLGSSYGTEVKGGFRGGVNIGNVRHKIVPRDRVEKSGREQGTGPRSQALGTMSEAPPFWSYKG